MKGAYSSPEGVLDREIQSSLFTDTTYAVDSGGDPEVIPQLTYEQIFGLPQKVLPPIQQLYLSVWRYGYGRETEMAG